jgi:HrpA-like RNA helicase
MFPSSFRQMHRVYNQKERDELMVVAVQLLSQLVFHHLNDVDGNCVLVFLPGIADIEEVCDECCVLKMNIDATSLIDV